MDSVETTNTSTMKESTNPQEGEKNEQQPMGMKRFCSVRYGLAIMIHLCNVIVSSQLFSLSIAIIAMVNHTVPLNHSNVSTEEYSGISTIPGVPVYEWSPEIQGFLLSACIYGAVITIVPSGYFAGIIGGKKICGLAMFTTSFLSLLIPLAADSGLPYLFLVRIAQGLAQGLILGALTSFWPKWAPQLERTQLNTIGFSGLTMGNFLVILGGGFLCESPGWPSIFYITGAFGCVYSLIWFRLAYDDPSIHPFISDSEKQYIISSRSAQTNSQSWSLPIRAMIKAIALWAIIVPSVCRFWLTSNLTTSLPMILDNMLDLNFKKTGFLSSLALISSWATMTLGGQLADFLLSKKIFKLLGVRKLFTFLGMFFPSLFIVSVPFMDSITGIVFLILTSAMNTLCYSGFIINPIDIAPRYFSFIMGLQTVSMFSAGLISPTVTGYFIYQNDETGWKNAFFLSSAINMFGMVFYLIFGQAEVQDWAKEQRLTRF